jgi:hypothetical protein
MGLVLCHYEIWCFIYVGLYLGNRDALPPQNPPAMSGRNNLYVPAIGGRVPLPPVGIATPNNRLLGNRDAL